MPDLAVDTDRGWNEVPYRIRCGRALGDPWETLLGPLRPSSIVVGQLGQSLDGRISTEPGQSTLINGPEGIAHLHRLRALVDAVVVGAGTVRADDPQLTVRHVAGPNPVRVVIDPSGTLPADSRAFAADGVHRIVITRQACRSINGGIEAIALPDTDGRIEPAAILDALRARSAADRATGANARPYAGQRRPVRLRSQVRRVSRSLKAAPESSHDGNRPAAAHAPAASARRRSRSSISSRNASLSAATSPGATNRPAEAGTVWGVAPPVGPTTGRP